MILVRSERAAKSVMESSTECLEGNLKLKVNQEKSMVSKATEIKFWDSRSMATRMGIAVES